MRKKLICMIMALGLCAGVAACSPKEPPVPETTQAEETLEEGMVAVVDEQDGFATGTWDGLTFTNPWLDMSVTLPEDSYIYTENDISVVLGAGQDVLINNGTFTDDQLKEAEIITVYDFMAAFPDSQGNIQLVYENTRYSPDGKEISEAGYLDVIAQQLASIEGMQFEIGEKEEVTLAGKTFTRLSTASMDQTMRQEFYCLRLGNRMATLTINYTPDSESMVRDLVAGITTAK